MDSLEHPRTLPDTTLDGGLVEKISDWEPAVSPVPDTTLDCQLMEGTTYLQHLALGVSLDSGLMAGMASPEPLEQSVLNTLWFAQPGRGITEEISDWVPDATLDGRLMEGTTYLEHSFLGVSLDSGLMEGMSGLEPVEQSVLNTLLAARPEEGISEELSDREPLALPDITLDGRPMEETTYLEHTWLWGCLWTVDSWRGCRVWNHWSSRFLVRCWPHDLLKYSRRRTRQSVRLWRRKWITDIRIWNCRRVGPRAGPRRWTFA